MGVLALPEMSVTFACGLCGSPDEVSNRLGFHCTRSGPHARNTVKTPSSIAFGKELRRRSVASFSNRRRNFYQPIYFPVTRALWSREQKRQESRPSDEFPPMRSSSRAPPPDVEEEYDVDELPSLFKTNRRKDSSPSTRPSAGGDGGGGWGFFPFNNDRDSGGSGASPGRSSPNKYLLAGMFVVGIGAGIALDTVVNVEPANVASREVIDRQTPNPDVCIANGMSAMVLDQRLFITFNPFNVYVSQAEVKPGCVLHQSNWRVLESRGLVNPEEVRDCKRNFNTFGFVGDLRQAPEITCVYHSENAENQFLKDPSKAALGDGFQPKTFNEP